MYTHIHSFYMFSTSGEPRLIQERIFLRGPLAMEVTLEGDPLACESWRSFSHQPVSSFTKHPVRDQLAQPIQGSQCADTEVTSWGLGQLSCILRAAENVPNDNYRLFQDHGGPDVSEVWVDGQHSLWVKKLGFILSTVHPFNYLPRGCLLYGGESVWRVGLAEGRCPVRKFRNSTSGEMVQTRTKTTAYHGYFRTVSKTGWFPEKSVAFQGHWKQSPYTHEGMTALNFQELEESRLYRVPHNWEVSLQDLHMEHVKQCYIGTLHYRKRALSSHRHRKPTRLEDWTGC